jgi:hypothetical protein
MLGKILSKQRGELAVREPTAWQQRVTLTAYSSNTETSEKDGYRPPPAGFYEILFQL